MSPSEEYEEVQAQAFSACSDAAKWIMKEKYEYARIKLDEAMMMASHAGRLLKAEHERQAQLAKESGDHYV